MEELPSLEDVSFASTSNYTIMYELGRGGMGIVYLAERNSEGVMDHVVLKTIRTIEPKQIEYLRKEANIATFLRHENIVKTYGLEAIPLSKLPPRFREQLHTLKPQTEENLQAKKMYRPKLIPPKGSLADKQGKFHSRQTSKELRDDEKLYCMAMDYVEGFDLGYLNGGHIKVDLLIPAPLAAFIISRICRALGYAHKFIVHRDISPENIMVNSHGVAKLTDFGIAVAAGQQKEFAGKLAYMSPEQLTGDKIDGRSDIFSLGLVAYQIVTGISLFAQPREMNFSEYVQYIAGQMAMGFPEPKEIRYDIPVELSNIISKMIETDVDKRYQSSEDVGNDLEKKYLYAKGFGPTNNSLAAYIELFQGDFKRIDQSKLKQLTFLRDENDKIAVHRLFSYDTYTKLGHKMIKETQKRQLTYKVLQKQARELGNEF